MDRYDLNGCIVVTDGKYLTTRFPDGSVADAVFIEDDDTRATARALGYGEDVARMHLEHELAHTFVSQAMGLPWSPVLQRVALKEPWTYSEERANEEDIVMAFQRFLNDGHKDPWLERIPDWREHAEEFRRRFRKPAQRARFLDANAISQDVKDVPVWVPYVSQAAPAQMAPAYVYRGTVKRVIDGDTYDVEIDLGFRVSTVQAIRLLGVDTPEMNTEAGKAARSAVIAFLDGYSNQIVLRSYKDKQSFSRWIAEVWTPDGLHLATWIRERGYAV